MASLRSSITHPIELAAVCRQQGTGSILYVSFAPGKTQKRSMSGGWSRSMDLDLERIRDHYKIGAIISLLEDHEIHALQIDDYSEKCQEYGLELYRFPFKDNTAPNMDLLERILETVNYLLTRGQNVMVHCKGGMGRAPTVCASFMCMHGIKPEIAINRLRECRDNRALRLKSQVDTVNIYYLRRQHIM